MKYLASYRTGYTQANGRERVAIGFFDSSRPAGEQCIASFPPFLNGHRMPSYDEARRMIEAKPSKPAAPVVIAIDDWMVWARDAQGRIVETCAEMWPEWLDEARDPSDMETDEYRAAVLRILRTKRPQWRDTVAAVTDPADPDAVQMVLSDLAIMEADQAAFIAAHR